MFYKISAIFLVLCVAGGFGTSFRAKRQSSIFGFSPFSLSGANVRPNILDWPRAVAGQFLNLPYILNPLQNNLNSAIRLPIGTGIPNEFSHQVPIYPNLSKLQADITTIKQEAQQSALLTQALQQGIVQAAQQVGQSDVKPVLEQGVKQTAHVNGQLTELQTKLGFIKEDVRRGLEAVIAKLGQTPASPLAVSRISSLLAQKRDFEQAAQQVAELANQIAYQKAHLQAFQETIQQQVDKQSLEQAIKQSAQQVVQEADKLNNESKILKQKLEKTANQTAELTAQQQDLKQISEQVIQQDGSQANQLQDFKQGLAQGEELATKLSTLQAELQDTKGKLENVKQELNKIMQQAGSQAMPLEPIKKALQEASQTAVQLDNQITDLLAAQKEIQRVIKEKIQTIQQANQPQTDKEAVAQGDHQVSHPQNSSISQDS